MFAATSLPPRLPPRIQPALAILNACHCRFSCLLRLHSVPPQLYCKVLAAQHTVSQALHCWLARGLTRTNSWRSHPVSHCAPRHRLVTYAHSTHATTTQSKHWCEIMRSIFISVIIFLFIFYFFRYMIYFTDTNLIMMILSSDFLTNTCKKFFGNFKEFL